MMSSAAVVIIVHTSLRLAIFYYRSFLVVMVIITRKPVAFDSMTNRPTTSFIKNTTTSMRITFSHLSQFRSQWRIQLWADRAAATPPPTDQNLGLVMAARLRLRHGVK